MLDADTMDTIRLGAAIFMAGQYFGIPLVLSVISVVLLFRGTFLALTIGVILFGIAVVIGVICAPLFLADLVYLYR